MATLGRCLEAASAMLAGSRLLGVTSAQARREARAIAAGLLREPALRPRCIHPEADLQSLLRAPSVSTLELDLSMDAFRRVTGAANRRARGEPLAYILGEKEFWSMVFHVNEKCLIPRSDSETLIEAMLEHYVPTIQDQNVHVADLYTGSGCLLLAALSELPAPASGVGYDISSNAVSIAQRNARRHHLDARAVFVEQDLSGPAPITNAASGKSCWDIVFANPPYIKSDDIPDLMPDVRDFEPSLALDGGPDGLDPYRDMASAVRDGRLRSQWLFLEVGHDQAGDIQDIFSMMNLVEVRKDLSGLDRCMVFRNL